jgi:cysteate synthase
MVARVLSHQQPPYSIQGGVFDVLQESQGDMLVADNRETLAAMHLFEEIEGIDIDPAAGVAFAALIKAVQSGRVVPSATIVLHITGGGWRRRQQETQLIPATPALQISKDQISTEETLQKILSLF